MARDRQNDAPTFERLIDIGSKHFGSLYSGYIVGDAHEDERITFDAILIPTITLTSIETVELLQNYRPDEQRIEKIGKHNYLRMAWV